METRRSLSQFKVNSYKQNFSYFDQYLECHRQHQVEALLAACKSYKGQIISPCGTGKTRIQISLHVQEMIDYTKEGKCGIFIIASHRLSLNRQLLGELVDVAINCGLPFDVLYVGSYRCDLQKYYTKYFNLGYTTNVSNHRATTDSKEIEQFVLEAKKLGRHVIIASTYDSFARLKNIGLIDQVTFDEAHNTTQDDFTANISEVKDNIKKQYYFTATRKVSDDGGMNNEEFYGKILFDAFPKQMLSRGEIVCPQMHRIESDGGQTTNTSNLGILVKNTTEALFMHRNKVKELSCSPDEIGAKLLVGCNSIEEMERIYFHDSIKALAKNSVQVFAISSDGCYVNWDKCGKEDFFIKLNNLSDPEDALIFNVDMLTEGINLPSITGVMPLRNLGLTKLIQLMGRSLRLHKTDRKNLYAGNIIPTVYKNYVKPYGWLIIPQHLSTINHFSEMIATARKFYEVYETTAEQLIVEEKYMPLKPQTLDTIIPFPFKDGKDYELEHNTSSLIDEINLNNFKNDMDQLNDRDKIEYIKRNMLT